VAEARLLERLNAQDLFMLWPDDFGWSQDIGALAILDGPGCWTAMAASGSKMSASTLSRDWPRFHASGSCCTARRGLDGPCESTRHPWTWPAICGSIRWPRRATRPSCWRHVRRLVGAAWIRPRRFGRPGCCPACEVVSIHANVTLAVGVLSYAGTAQLHRSRRPGRQPRPRGVRTGYSRP